MWATPTSIAEIRRKSGPRHEYVVRTSRVLRTSRVQWWRRVRRFVVAEESMLPTYHPGDGIIAIDTARIRRGEVRVFQHPHRPDFWLVKRVGDIIGDRFVALSDNPSVAAVDSRRFGLVPIEGSYRVVARVKASR